MENFITGYPATEYQIREALAEVVGREKSEFFFDKVRCPCISQTYSNPPYLQFLEYFFSEDDAIYFKKLGLNCIRIAFNYRHFEGAFAERPSQPNTPTNFARR
jgi:hypothetical protein